MRHICCILLALTAALLPNTALDARQHRDHKAVAAFKRDNPCPSNGARRGSCPGYVVDHVTALACGGPDHPSNMQWQTIPDAKAKDRWERIGCR